MPITPNEIAAIVDGVVSAAKAHIASEFAKRDGEIAALRARLDAVERRATDLETETTALRSELAADLSDLNRGDAA
jgi:hypothetical protein